MADASSARTWGAGRAPPAREAEAAAPRRTSAPAPPRPAPRERETARRVAPAREPRVPAVRVPPRWRATPAAELPVRAVVQRVRPAPSELRGSPADRSAGRSSSAAAHSSSAVAAGSSVEAAEPAHRNPAVAPGVLGSVAAACRTHSADPVPRSGSSDAGDCAVAATTWEPSAVEAAA